MELLVAKGADVNAQDDYAVTALHVASVNGDNEVVELLIERGLDFNAKVANGSTVLSLAVQNGKIKVVELFSAWS